MSGTTPRPSRPEELIDPALMARLDRLDVRSRKMFPGKLQGERRAKRRGQSVEFDDYRNYVPGDDLRHIDWNVYARMDRLFIKLFLEEEDLAVHLAIDASASMEAGPPSKLMYAARLATAMGYIGLVQNNRVAVSVFGRPGQRRLEHLPDLRGRRHFRRMGSFLIDSLWGERTGGGRAAPEAEFNEALTSIARMRVGKGVMVVISDFMTPEGYESGLKSLAAAGGYDTWCVQLLTPGEAEPEKQGVFGGGAGRGGGGMLGDLRLTDIETGKAAEVTVTAQLLKRYKQRLEAYCAELAGFCAAREMAHVLVRTDTELQTLVLDTLRRRGLIG